MKTHVEFERVKRGIVRTLVLMLSFALTATTIPAQVPPNPVSNENIPAGALVIPMDNVNQGNAAGTTFNLRAYGLANLLLQNDVHLKWVIKPGKAKDGVDFSASVTRIAGTAGSAAGTLSFSGGPFVVPAEFDVPAVRDLIDSFNGSGDPVTVYKTTADTTADVYFNVTHKPRIAIGPDTGNFGAAVFQSLFQRAGIPSTNYVTGVENINQPGSCFTLATQGHQTNAAHVNTFKQFVQRGGNLILQCASVGTFENDPQGLFQTTAGWSLFTSNNPVNEINSNVFSFPEGSMPFNQFIGALADQDGAVTEYAFAPGSGPAHNYRPSVVNTGVNSDKLVASVSQYNGTNVTGGVVFEFGGHDYARLDDAGETVDLGLPMLNGQRMQLNSVFVPAGVVCVQPQDVVGFKSVKRINMRQGGPPIAPGDTLEWIIDYVNAPQNQSNHFDFQVRDIVGEFAGFQTYAGPGDPANLVVTAHNGAVAAENPAFDGVGNDASADMLADGAFLPIGGRIQIKIRTIIAANVLLVNQNGYTLFNQTTARSASLNPTPTTKSDAIDSTSTLLFDVPQPPAGSVDQIDNGGIIDPTQVSLIGPTAADASIEGRVIGVSGTGIANALVTVVKASTGEVRSTRSNAMGVFRIDDLEVGDIYLVTVTHKRYQFATEPIVIDLSDNVTGLTITGQLPVITKAGGQQRASR